MTRVDWVLALAVFCVVMHGRAALAQSAQPPESPANNGGYLGDDSSRDKPSFTPSGVAGATSPSGYSAGESADQAMDLKDRALSLDAGISLAPPSEPVLDCNRKSDLLLSAQAHPAAFSANHELGVFYLQHGEINQGIEFLKRAYDLKPLDDSNMRRLTLAYITTGQFAPAIDLLKSRMKLDQDAGPVLLLASVYALMPDRADAVAAYQLAATRNRGEKNLFAAGMGLLSLAATDEALALFTQGTGLYPLSARLWLGLGIAQSLSASTAAPANTLLHAVDLDPGYLPAYLFLAGAPNAAGADEKILPRLEALVTAHPNSAEAHYDYALALWQHGHFPPDGQRSLLAQTQLKLAIARDPAFAAAHFKLGVVYQEAGDFALAERELEWALRLDPDNAAGHYRLAQVYRRTHQPAMADRELEQFNRRHAGLMQADDSTQAGLRAYAARLLPAPTSAFCH